VKKEKGEHTPSAALVSSSTHHLVTLPNRWAESHHGKWEESNTSE